MNKFVLDTNIYFSYVYNANLTNLIQLILDNELEIYLSDQLMNELLRNLTEKRIFERANIHRQELIEILSAVTIRKNPKKSSAGSPDPTDDFLFDLCTENKCVLITGDKKLLRWKNSPIQVMDLTAFKKIWM